MTSQLKKLVSADHIVQFMETARRSVSPSLQILLGPEKPRHPGENLIPIELAWGETVFLTVDGLSSAQIDLVKAAVSSLLAYEHEICDMTRELSEVYEELTLLYQLSKSFSETLNLDLIQKNAISEIASTLEVRKVSFLMLDEDKENLILTSGLGIKTGEIGKPRFSKGKGLAWKVIDSGKSLIANDIRDFPEYIPGTEPERSLLMVPLTTKRGLVGILTVSDKIDGSEFSSKDEKLLSTIAQQMGAFWENARLYREIRELFLNTVEALSAAIDAKDPYTHGHSQRVTSFSVAIASQMGLHEEEVENIRIAALLHDIGKLGISENILRKPDRLTKEEFGEIKRHPSIGAEIMGKVKTLTRFIPGMVDHHERFDGSGYPLGRIGQEISIAGRIIAVADTLDAITSNRPYHQDKKGKPDDFAINEITRCSGSHFDPGIVEAFLKAYKQGLLHTQSSQS